MKISLKEDINSLSYFKTHFNQVIKKLENNHRPLIITQNGKTSGVFLDIGTWETILKKIQLLKLLNEGEMSLSNEAPKSVDQVEKFFNKKYGL
ncbi:MAG: type II toxin-antitoxin system Phd/YefM family antitoxin [Spirochaetes bacterium]|nr:type II toxin-antitoxin system Phd/YefM family antitoxin [Spirochaetota bacterium]